MILDERLEFADATSVVQVGGGTFLLGDVVDLSVARDIGTPGDISKLTVTIQVTADILTAGTVQFRVVSDSEGTLTTSKSVHVVSKAFDAAELVLGAEVHLDLPPQATFEPYEQFLAVDYVATAAITAGAVNAFVNRDAGNNVSYQSPSQYK
ncbi:MAG: Bbp16 family capsid cement protein [Candidatus Binatia bacterium]